MLNNKILLTVGAVAATFIFLLIVYKFVNGTATSNFPEINIIKTTDHVKWSPDKKNVLIEYSDFQCPACKYVHEMLKKMESSNSADFAVTKKVTFIFRHFPLSQIHNQTLLASYAAEAAGKQNKFYEMSDLIFNGQGEWDKSNDPMSYFNKYAQSLKLDMDQFKKDVNSDEVKNKVQEDISLGNKANIDATPTFYLNGNKLEITRSFDDLVNTLRNL